MKKIISAIVLTLFICLCFTACDSSQVLQKDVYISEVMSNNLTTLSDENGDLVDWIELHNPTDKAINLAGYMITDASDNIDKFIFPEITIKSGEYFIIYANGIEKIDIENRVIHVPFSLSTKGESIFLYNAKRIIQLIGIGYNRTVFNNSAFFPCDSRNSIT